MHKHTMTGVQSLNNFSYEGEGLRTWCAYNMGPGKFFTLGILAQLVLHKEQQILPLYYHSEDQTRKLEPWQRRDLYNRLLFNPAPLGQIPPPIAKRKKTRTGCHSLGPRKDVSKCTSHFLLCTGILMWESTLQGFNAILSMTRSSANGQKPASPCWWISSVCTFHLGCSHSGQTWQSKRAFYEEGWAPKKVTNAVNFSENVRNYLREVFLLGEETGHKASPGDVAVRMKGLQNSSGKKRFQEKEWLTTLQISRYFSRLSTLNKSGRPIRDTDATSPNADNDEDEDDVLTIETPAIRTRQQIRPELEL